MAEKYLDREAVRRSLAQAMGTDGLSSDDPQRVRVAQESAWLQSLYSELRTHLEGDLNRQWGILRIFVPLSLAPFAAVVVEDDLSTRQVALLGVASSTLLLAANIFSDRLSQFTRKSWSWIAAIESECGLPQLRAGPVTRWFPVSRVRWALQALILGMWLVIAATG